MQYSLSDTLIVLPREPCSCLIVYLSPSLLLRKGENDSVGISITSCAAKSAGRLAFSVRYSCFAFMLDEHLCASMEINIVW